MSNKNTNQLDLGKTPIKKLFWTYAIPSILGMIAQSTAGFVDSIFMGRYVGPEGLSAVTLMFPIVGLLAGVAIMFTVGGTTLAGIELGRENPSKSNNYFNLTVFFLAALSFLLVLFVLLFIEKVPALVGAHGITAEYLITYGRTLGLFFPFFLLNFAFMFFLKLDGKPMLMVGTMIAGTIINILLDYLLIGHLKMSVYGAALATGLSQLVPWLILFSTVLFKSQWKIRLPKIRWNEIGQILFNGSSELLSNIAFSISGFMFNLIIINRMGVTGVAAYAVSLQIAGLATSIGYGFGESNQTGISYNIGAGNFERVKGFYRMTLAAGLVSGLLLFAAAFWAGEILSGMFVTDRATITLATKILKYYAFAFIFLGANVFFGTYYTAINDPIRSGAITLYRSLVGLVIGLALFVPLMGNSGIWMSLVFAEVTTFVIGLNMVKRKPFGREGIVLAPADPIKEKMVKLTG